MTRDLDLLRGIAVHPLSFQCRLILDVGRGEYASLDEEDPDTEEDDCKSHDQEGYDDE